MSAPGPISRFVTTVAWRSRGAYAVEALALGAAAGASTAAAAVFSGAAAGSLASAAACAISALACAATWAVEHRRTAREVARRADERLGERGALATAFECEARADPGPIERALVARVASGLAPGSARRAAHAVSIAVLAAPLIGGGVLAAAWELAGERAGSAIARGGSGPATATSAGASAEPAGASEGASETDPHAGEAAAARADDRAATGADETAPLDEEVGASPIRTETAGAATGEERTAAGESGAGGDTGSDVAGADTGASGTGDASGLARRGADPTMSGSTVPVGPPMIATPADATRVAAHRTPEPSVEAGTLAGRWWPARHDEIVRAWIAIRAR